MYFAWIEYKKAFDKVPHTWIIEALKMYRTSSTLLSFISKTMKMCNTDLHIQHTDVRMKTTKWITLYTLHWRPETNREIGRRDYQTAGKEFSDDIGMEFGLDRCAKATFIESRLQKEENIRIDNSITIQALDQMEEYNT